MLSDGPRLSGLDTKIQVPYRSIVVANEHPAPSWSYNRGFYALGNIFRQDGAFRVSNRVRQFPAYMPLPDGLLQIPGC